jgi:hypothetical protein
LHPGDLFCGNCGASVAPTGSATAPENTGAVPSIEQTLPNPVASSNVPTMPPPVGVLPAVEEPLESDEKAPVEDAPVRARAATVTRQEVADLRRQLRTGRRLRILAGAGVVILVAAVATLGLMLISTRGDLDNERAKLAQAQATLNGAVSTTTTTEAPESAGTTPTDDRLAQVQTELAQTQAALQQARDDLLAEKQARADDAAAAAAAQEAAVEAAKTEAAAEAVATASSEVAAAQEQAATLATLFPLTQEQLSTANPVGNYLSEVAAGECTLNLCELIQSLDLNITDPTTITGNRFTGTLAFDGTTYTASGALDPAVGPKCNDVPADPTYALALRVIGVDVAGGALEASRLQGTYTETIASGDCAGQHRSFTVTLDRQPAG